MACQLAYATWGALSLSIYISLCLSRLQVLPATQQRIPRLLVGFVQSTAQPGLVPNGDEKGGLRSPNTNMSHLGFNYLLTGWLGWFCWGSSNLKVADSGLLDVGENSGRELSRVLQ